MKILTKEDFSINFENPDNYLQILLTKKEPNSVRIKAKYSTDFLKKFRLFSEGCKNIKDIYSELYIEKDLRFKFIK